MKPIRIKGKNYTPTLSFVVAFGLTLLVIIGSFFLGYWIIRAQTLAQGSAAATSSPASAASVASKIALIPTLAFEGSASGDPLAALMTPDNVMNIAFMAVAFFVVLIMTVDLLFRQNVSHIVMVLVCGLLFSAYALARTIFNLAITRDHVGSGVLYLIAFAGSLLMLYFFVKKALDGDADFSYLLTGGLTLLFFFLGCATNF